MIFIYSFWLSLIQFKTRKAIMAKKQTKKQSTLIKDNTYFITWGIIGESTREASGLYTYSGITFVTSGIRKFVFISVKTGEQLSPLSEELLKGKVLDLGTLQAEASTEVSSDIWAND